MQHKVLTRSSSTITSQTEFNLDSSQQKPLKTRKRTAKETNGLLSLADL